MSLFPLFVPTPLRGFTQTFDFVRSLFSWSYELLFPQLLCFDIHLSCPEDVGRCVPQTFNLRAFKAANSIPDILLHALCRSHKSQLLCNQANPRSFNKTPGVGG